MINWKKVATKRLQDIRSLEIQAKRIASETEELLYRELAVALHQRCVGGVDIARAIAQQVAENLRPKLYGR